MAEIIRMPRMSDTMEEGNIVEWLKEEGDTVEPGDILAEVETDKATMELESYHEGVLLHIGVKEGPVPVNSIIAVIGEEGEDYQAQLDAAESENRAKSEDGAESNTREETDHSDVQTKESVSSSPPPKSEEPQPANDDDRIKASPLARKMAEEAGIPLAQVIGTGDQGRIIKRDIESFKASSHEVAATSDRSLPTTGTGEDVAVSQMRKVIARRLSDSKFSAPHFYLTREIDMDAAMKARKQINAMDGVKISYNDMVVKACASALRHHPAINASWLGDTIRYHSDINIGVAVAIDEGLVVPVLPRTDLLGMSQINAQVRDKAARAKERKLSPDEMQGNTFTISNLGMFGIEEFTAIINPPDACILAVGSIQEKPVVKEGEIRVGHRMKVTLSCDHRIVDGATGAQFLQTLASMLEDPMRMLV